MLGVRSPQGPTNLCADLNPPCSPGPGSWSLHRAALREWPLGLLLGHGAGAWVSPGDPEEAF